MARKVHRRVQTPKVRSVVALAAIQATGAGIHKDSRRENREARGAAKRRAVREW